MHHTMAPNKLLEIPTSLRLLLTVNQRGYLGAGFPSRARSFSHTNPLLISSNSLPRILQPSLWHTILPKRFRRSKESITAADAGQGRRKWNPATPFIVLGLLIGSQAIHTLVLRNQMAAYSRKAEAKIALLKEIVERIQRGEDVAVEKLLGTDDPTQEKEWAEGMLFESCEAILFQEYGSRHTSPYFC